MGGGPGEHSSPPTPIKKRLGEEEGKQHTPGEEVVSASQGGNC